MNTFLNIRIEFPVGHPYRNYFIARNVIVHSLHKLISQRGEQEQYASIMRTSYNTYGEPTDEYARRRRKSTSIKNNKFTCVIN